MDKMEMIRQRHSVRSYLDKPLEAETRRAMLSEIERINAESGLHIQYLDRADRVFGSLASKLIGWKHVPGFLALIGRDEAGLEEKCGYYGEKLVLFLQSLGLNTCWVGMFRADAVKAEVRQGERLVITVVVGYGSNPGKPHRSKRIEEVTDVQDMPGWFRAGVESALLAPTAINQQKFFCRLENGEPKISEVGSGPFLKVDLGIVRCHFEAASGRSMRPE